MFNDTDESYEFDEHGDEVHSHDDDHEDLDEFTFRHNAPIVDPSLLAAVVESTGIDHALQHAAIIARQIQAVLGDADAHLAAAMADIIADLTVVSLEWKAKPWRTVARIIAAQPDRQDKLEMIGEIRSTLDQIQHELMKDVEPIDWTHFDRMRLQDEHPPAKAKVSSPKTLEEIAEQYYDGK